MQEVADSFSTIIVNTTSNHIRVEDEGGGEHEVV